MEAHAASRRGFNHLLRSPRRQRDAARPFTIPLGWVVPVLTVAIFAVLGVLAGISPTSVPLAIALGIFAISSVLVQAVVPRLKAREAARRAAMGTCRPRRPQPAPAYPAMPHPSHTARTRPTASQRRKVWLRGTLRGLTIRSFLRSGGHMPSATIRVRVPFVDVDSSQRIHFTAMFRYMEVAEHELMRAVGLPYATFLGNLAMPRVHLSCDFTGAVVFDDQLAVEARVEKVGTTSWTVGFTARKVAGPGDAPIGDDEQVVARGRMVIVTMDPTTEKAVPLPNSLRRALSGD